MIAAAILAFALLTHACVSHGRLPDRVCSPGAVDVVSLAVICHERTSTRRHVTEATKRLVLAEYGIAWAERASVEVDHLVPLALAGSNVMANLFAQPIADAKVKDRAEAWARVEVCAGRMSLAEAQRRFEEDWTTVMPEARR